MNKPVNCDGCGLCCFMTTALRPLDQNHAEIPAELLTELLDYRDGPLNVMAIDSGPCLWLKRLVGCDARSPAWHDPARMNGRCVHYDHRPPSCREFTLGGPECLALREEVGLDA